MSEEQDTDDVGMCAVCDDEYNIAEADNGDHPGHNLCLPCQDTARVCDHCRTTVQEDYTHWLDNLSMLVCEDCYARNYWFCNDCDNYVNIYNTCYCNENDEDSEDGLIHDYSYQPTPTWYVRQMDTNTIVRTNRPEFIKDAPFMGFELEIESPHGERSDLASLVLENTDGWVYLKNDGSLDYGFEIVSHPHTMSAFNLRDWSWIKKLSDNGARSWNTGSCGLHVHINKSAFKNNSHIWRFTNLILYNRHQATKLAGRNDSQWASFYREYKKVGKILKGDLDPERYTAVNLRNYRTIEVRMFRGSLHEPRVRASLEFVNANFEYTKTLTSHDVLRNNALDWFVFTDWVEQNQSYPHLMSYLNIIKERSDRVSTML